MHSAPFNLIDLTVVTFTMNLGNGPLSFSGKLIAGITHSLFIRFQLPDTSGNSMVGSLFCSNQDSPCQVRCTTEISSKNQISDYKMTCKFTSRFSLLGVSLFEQVILLFKRHGWISAAARKAKHWGTNIILISSNPTGNFRILTAYSCDGRAVLLGGRKVYMFRVRNNNELCLYCTFQTVLFNINSFQKRKTHRAVQTEQRLLTIKRKNYPRTKDNEIHYKYQMNDIQVQ